MTPVEPVPPTPQVKVRRWRAFFVLIAGALVTATPFFLSCWQGDAYGTWPALTSSTLTNVGTAIALAVVLYLLERSFTRHVTGVVTQQVKVETEQQTRGLRETTQTLQSQVDDLARELAESLNRISADRDAAVQAARVAPTFDAITDLLERANDLQALWHDMVVFPADDGLDAPRFSIFWGPPRQQGRGSLYEEAPAGPPSLMIAYEVPDEGKRGGYSPAEVSWRQGQRPADLLAQLTETLRTAGYAGAANRVGPNFFDSLAPAVEAAIAGREQRQGFWMRGRLHDWIADGWAVTDEGLENHDGHRVAAEEFPSLDAMSATAKSDAPKWKPPADPDDVDPELWRLAIARARLVHHSSTSVFDWLNAASGYTTGNSPRRG